MSAVVWQRIEGGLVLLAAMFAVVVIAAFEGGPAWWVWLLVFFAPDLAFAGYLAGPKIGAAVYNAVHIYGFGAVVAAAGVALDMMAVVSLGLLWVGHAGFDRALGYGLKLPSGFADTHLGRIGQKQTEG